MFLPILRSTALASLLSLASFTIQAEIRYIDDTLKIPLRSGPSTEHRILRFLSSGAKVDQLKLDENDESWAMVTLESGKEKEGWVQVKYLRNTPAAKELLAYSRKELEKVKALNKEQNQTIKELKDNLKNVSKELETLKKHSASTDKELTHIKDISKNAIRLDHSNNELLEENELLKADQEENQQLITKLESDQRNTGILFGTFAVLCGVVLGWIMSKAKGRRSDGWA